MRGDIAMNSSPVLWSIHICHHKPRFEFVQSFGLKIQTCEKALTLFAETMFQLKQVCSRVSFQGLHGSKAGFVDRVRHSGAPSTVPFRGLLRIRPTNPPFFSPETECASGVSFAAYLAPKIRYVYDVSFKT